MRYTRLSLYIYKVGFMKVIGHIGAISCHVTRQGLYSEAILVT